MSDDTGGPPARAAGPAFLERSRMILVDEMMPRIRRAVEVLPAEDLWWRPNDVSNSVGNLLLHLAGNLRQWIVSGAGEAPDVRRRDEEFSQDGGASPEELLEALEETVREASDVLAELDAGSLLESCSVQGREVSVMYAVYHAVEHFAMHAGQIIYVAKLRAASDLEFFRFDEGVPRRNW